MDESSPSSDTSVQFLKSAQPVRRPGVLLAFLTGAVILAVDLGLGLVFIPEDLQRIRRPDPYYHHGFLPMQDAQAQWGSRTYPLRTNSLGLRDKNTREVALRSVKRRILLMGDSFTEGVGVSYEESFAGILDERCAAAGIEVLNGGVMGYSPLLYYLKTRYLLERMRLRFDELIVLVDLSDVPDEFTHYRGFRPDLSDPNPAFLARVGSGMRRHSFLSYVLWTLVRDRPQKSIWDQNLLLKAQRALPAPDLKRGAIEHPDSTWPEEITDHKREAMRLATANLQLLVDLCRTNDIVVRIVVYPWPRQVYRSESENAHVQLWRAFASQNGLPFLNLIPDFLAGATDPDKIYERYYIEGDVHWNPAGHAFVAERLWNLIRGTRSDR